MTGVFMRSAAAAAVCLPPRRFDLERLSLVSSDGPAAVALAIIGEPAPEVLDMDVVIHSFAIDLKSFLRL